MGLYEEILAETNDPELAQRIVGRIRRKGLLNSAQRRALEWLQANDPTLHTLQEIADQLGVSSAQQVVSLFGSLVHKGHCGVRADGV